jgi:hypothetical protein
MKVKRSNTRALKNGGLFIVKMLVGDATGRNEEMENPRKR